MVLVFDFINGFYDIGNVMVILIVSGVLVLWVVVVFFVVLNLIGVFLFIVVVVIIVKGLIDVNLVMLELVFVGLVGGIVWNLLIWLLGILLSFLYVLIGGIVGVIIVVVGLCGVIWSGVVFKVIVLVVVVVLLVMLVGVVGIWLVYWMMCGVVEKCMECGFWCGQIGLVLLVLLVYGINDVQKMMGVIFLVLMFYGVVSMMVLVLLLWVIVSCVVVMVVGIYLGGWCIICILGKGLVEIKLLQGMVVELLLVVVILLFVYFGYVLFIMQVVIGFVLGSGVGKFGVEVCWGVVGCMVVVWLVMFLLVGLVGVFIYGLVYFIGGYFGVIFGFVLLWLIVIVIWLWLCRVLIDYINVNVDWEGNLMVGLEVGVQLFVDQRLLVFVLLVLIFLLNY